MRRSQRVFDELLELETDVGECIAIFGPREHQGHRGEITVSTVERLYGAVVVFHLPLRLPTD
jgi:hypothetical protein